MKIKSIGIVGYGDFGTFLYALAKEHFPGVDVKVSSTHAAPDGTQFFPLEDVCKTDLLFLTVPISAFESVVEKVLPLLGSDTIVCDVATVKKYTIDILKKKGVKKFLATHPMFGPYSYAKQGNSLKGLRIALCDGNLPVPDYMEVLKFLESCELKVLELNADEHDRLIASTLFLTHLVGQIVRRGGFERTSIDTVSFGYLMDAMESVAHDEALFRDVFTYNPYCKEVLEKFELTEKEVAALLQ